MIVPEARVMGTTGVAELVKWTVATVAGLGVFDTVAGATTLSQLLPTPVVSPLPATSGAGFSMTAQVTGAPGNPGSWSISVGALPPGITKSNSGSTCTLSGTPTVAGSFTFTLKAWENSGNSGGSVSKAFTISVAAVAPTITTPTSASIAATSATLGGNVTSDGGDTITRGVVYSITTANNSPAIGGTGVTRVIGTATTGVSTISATGLSPGTGYSYKAYVINSVGTVYTTVSTFTTLAAPTITTPTSASITTSSATLGGNVTSNGGATITARGVVYSITSTNANPAIGGAGVMQIAGSTATGVSTINTTGLAPGTGYSFKAYATNSVGTTYTSPVSTFTTLVAVPTVTTPTSAGIAATSATLGGNVTSNGGGAISASGVVYSITSANADPLIGGTGVTNAPGTGTTGVFTIGATGLAPGTGYSFKAYATNSAGTIYTTPVSTFTTLAAPTVTTPTTASIATTSATLGGNVTSDGGAALTACGVVYSITTANGDPIIGGSGVTQATATAATGVFTISAASLAPGTGYSFKVYASNSAGTTYTTPVSSFTTLADTIGTFATWQSAQFTVAQMADPAISGPTADPDGDGITNEKEYVFGLLPMTAELAPIPSMATSAGQLSVSFTAKAASGSGYAGKTRHYALENAANLVSGTWASPAGYEDIIASDQNVNYSGSQSGPTQFYKLHIWLTP